MTLVTVLAGAIVMRIADPDNFETFGESVWFTLQTATTVGYGDTVPTNAVGQFVASIVMLLSVAIVTVTTAFVTSLFVQSAAAARMADLADDQDDAADAIARLEASLASVLAQLDRMEQAAGRQTSAGDGAVSRSE